MRRFLQVISSEDVETQVFCWGTVQWLSEPRVTGSPCMLTGVFTLNAGKSLGRNSHAGLGKNIYVLDGAGSIVLEDRQGKTETLELHKGVLASLHPGQYHAVDYPHGEPLVFLAVYEFAGAESQMRSSPGCQEEPAKNA